MSQKPQLWFCDRCCVVGVVMFEEHADVMTVSGKIRDAHVRYRPECMYRERVIVVENLKKDTILCTGKETL